MKISDTQLLQETKMIAKQEQMKTLELLKYLTEIDRRMAYVKLGYTSLLTSLKSWVTVVAKPHFA